MAQFCMKIAGVAARVESLFESTRDYCRNYLTEEEPEFTIIVTRENLEFEQEDLRREAVEEGMRLRRFTDPFLDRAAIQRQFAEFLLTRETLMLHGSTVAVDGQAYLFTAKCGAGKSTHTRLWCQVFGDRAVMINDDKPFLKITGEDVAACGAPWSGKHGLDTNVQLPLKGICILERGQENRVFPIPAAEAEPMLRKQSYYPLSPETAKSYESLLQLLLQRVPCYRMTCTKDTQAARVAHGVMSGDFSGNLSEPVDRAEKI